MKNVIFILFALVVIIACNKKDDDNCLEYKSSFVVSVNAPSSGSINEDINVEIQFLIGGCEKFNEFKESTYENTITIEVFIKHEGCICPDVAASTQGNYVFNSPTPGDYELKFKSSGHNGNPEFIIANITIE